MSWERLKLSERDNALYGKLSMSALDIAKARSFANQLRKKRWHTFPLVRRGSVPTYQVALTTALVVAYARPFVVGRGGGLAFPNRLKQYTPEQEELHRRLLKLRHEQFAHTDPISYEIRPYDDPYIKSVDMVPETYFTAEEIDLFLEMTGGVLNRINSRMEEIHASARTRHRS